MSGLELLVALWCSRFSCLLVCVAPYAVLTLLPSPSSRLLISVDFMPLEKGFKRTSWTPMRLTHHHRLKPPTVVVPLARPGSRQVNPIYSQPPGAPGSTKLTPNYREPLEATRFGYAAAYGYHFVYAEVISPWGTYPHPVYLNIWGSQAGAPTTVTAYPFSAGTLYCTLKHQENGDPECLCGRCWEWLPQGWVCPLVWCDVAPTN